MRRVRQSLPKWEDLQSLPSLSYIEQVYSIHDVVHILMEDGRDEMAQIRQIRDLGNGRKVILVLFASLSTASSYPERSLARLRSVHGFVIPD